MRSSCPFPLPMLNCFLQSNFKITHSAGLPPLLLEDYSTVLGCISHHQEVFPDTYLELSFLSFCSIIHSYTPFDHSKQYTSLLQNRHPSKSTYYSIKKKKKKISQVSQLSPPPHTILQHDISDYLFSLLLHKEGTVPLHSSSVPCTDENSSNFFPVWLQSLFLLYSGDREVSHIYVGARKSLWPISLLLHVVLLLEDIFICVAQAQHRLQKLLQLEWDKVFLF